MTTLLTSCSCPGQTTWTVRRWHSNWNLNIEIQLWQRIVTEDPLQNPLHQLEMCPQHIFCFLNLFLELFFYLVMGFCNQCFLFPRRKLKEGLDICNCCINLMRPVITYQFSENNFKVSIYRHFPFLLLLSERENILEFFHDRTAEALSSVSRILIPTLLNLLYNMYLMVMFHSSMLNSCVLNSWHLKLIFYYYGLIQLHRCLSVNHNRRTFISYLHKKIRLMRSVTSCCIYFQHVHLRFIQFLFCDFLWLWNTRQ